MKLQHKYLVVLTAGKNSLKLMVEAQDTISAAEQGKKEFKTKYKKAPESITVEREE